LTDAGYQVEQHGDVDTGDAPATARAAQLVIRTVPFDCRDHVAMAAEGQRRVPGQDAHPCLEEE
jgi:hypothetical protein